MLLWVLLNRLYSKEAVTCTKGPTTYQHPKGVPRNTCIFSYRSTQTNTHNLNSFQSNLCITYKMVNTGVKQQNLEAEICKNKSESKISFLGKVMVITGTHIMN